LADFGSGEGSGSSLVIPAKAGLSTAERLVIQLLHRFSARHSRESGNPVTLLFALCSQEQRLPLALRASGLLSLLAQRK
jgi:hypothetical protein